MLNIKQLEKLENDYLDLQIKEINEKEKREKEIIETYYKNKVFIFENLENKKINFDFEIIENEEYNFFNCCSIYVKFNNDFLFINNIYIFEDYNYINILTLEEINKIKEYKRQKDKEKQKDEYLEFEI
ncbi:hypothetical protein [Aliarcobacter butzleri]|jgi:hypothetical protein|uniref:hypothetical protein n=1 Tax=Aliarcobacter butzleri TaxID=28197 RepID=UPI00214B6E5A|nr:hypothetical protein [Aliarcobacter butzleri]MCP3649697.1 hypothetical protein [Arcobacter sp. DNRA7]MCR1815870.1 hypothetical protein [Aliarcobacter butzleri]MDX9901677.1 hypothetical protein [Aliarcobacter sp.]